MPASFEAPFDATELEARVSRVRREMQKKKLDLFVLSSPENIYFLTGYGTKGVFAFQMLVVPPAGSLFFVTRAIESGNAKLAAASSDVRITTYDDTQPPSEVVAAVLKALGGAHGQIGCEKRNWFLTVERYEELQRLLPGARLIDATEIVESLRAIKSPVEIEYLRRAAALSDHAVEAVIAATRDGMTENDVAATVIQSLISGGSEYIATWPNIKAGWRTGLAHAAWAGERVTRGSWFTMEFAGVVRRYHAPIYRTVFIGEPDSRFRHMADVLRHAHDAGIGALRPGRTVGDVDAAQRSVIEDAGYGSLMSHRTGYSVGIGFPPTWAQTFGISILPNVDTQLAPGMVFHMVMYLFQPAEFGMGLGQTVLVKDDGPDVLSQLDKGPIFLPG